MSNICESLQEVGLVVKDEPLSPTADTEEIVEVEIERPHSPDDLDDSGFYKFDEESESITIDKADTFSVDDKKSILDNKIIYQASSSQKGELNACRSNPGSYRGGRSKDCLFANESIKIEKVDVYAVEDPEGIEDNGDAVLARTSGERYLQASRSLFKFCTGGIPEKDREPTEGITIEKVDILTADEQERILNDGASVQDKQSLLLGIHSEEGQETSENNFELSKGTSKSENIEKQFNCEQCGKVFSANSCLIRHLRNHTDGKPYNCSHCGLAFPRRKDLIEHRRTHTGEKEYNCEQCGKVFSANSVLKKHRRTHNGVNPFKCDICEESFPLKGELLAHQRAHRGAKPYVCPHCGKSFSQNHNFKAHYRIHTGEKPYNCKYCGKLFTDSSAWRRHLRTHTGERPYRCDQCGKSFLQSANLRSHLRVHTGEKPHKCEECGKSFSRSSHFKKHIRIHTGEKPFSCEYCRWSFSRVDNLKTHLRIHTVDKPYTCIQCGLTFEANCSFQIHLRSHIVL